MFLLDWYKQYLEIKYNSRKLKNEVVVEEKVCQSCETLKQQLEFSNYEKKQLLAKILKEPEPTPVTEAPQITRPRTVPWHVRRQMLEAEDRVKAQRLREAPKPDSPEVVKEETAELERELDIAGKERETTTGT
jgi:hypothetical protein